MNSKSILLFLVGFASAYFIYRNKKTDSPTPLSNNTTASNTNQSGGHLIIQPIEVGTPTTDTLNVPVPDINIILPKP